MKKSSILMLVCGLALMLVMYNCTKADHPDPQQPDQSIVDEINKITLGDVDFVEPEPVKSTASGIEESAAKTALDAGIKSGNAAVLAAVTTLMENTFTPSEITLLSSVSDATLAAIAAGGPVPADLLALLNKMKANPATAAYLPKVTLPTVEGVEISGLRTGGVDQVAKTEVSDICIENAEAEFTKVKVKLDAELVVLKAEAAAQYAADIAGIPAAEKACGDALPAKYAALAADAKAEYDELKGLVTPAVRATLFLAYLDYITALVSLQAADLEACGSIADAELAAAQAAKVANDLAADGVYATALAAATVLKIELIQSCHNQGGGL